MAAIFRLNEAEALLAIEPFNDADLHSGPFPDTSSHAQKWEVRSNFRRGSKARAGRILKFDESARRAYAIFDNTNIGSRELLRKEIAKITSPYAVGAISTREKLRHDFQRYLRYHAQFRTRSKRLKQESLGDGIIWMRFSSGANSAALEYAARGIRINAVCPGIIDTPMVAEMKETQAEAMAELLKVVPAGRLGRAEEIADAVLWLCGPRSTFVVGQAIAVTRHPPYQNLGRTRRPLTP